MTDLTLEQIEQMEILQEKNKELLREWDDVVLRRSSELTMDAKKELEYQLEILNIVRRLREAAENVHDLDIRDGPRDFSEVDKVINDINLSLGEKS